MTGTAPKSATALICVGLALTVGVGSPRSAARRQRTLSFASTTGVVTAPGAASVLVDRASGRFFRVKRQSSGKPRIAIADAIGDLNGDGRPDFVTHYNSDEDGEGITIDGVTIYPAYAYVSLSRRKGGFRGTHQVWENDYADVAADAVGDVNGDGRPDLELATVDEDGDSAILVFLNRGRGRLQRVKQALRPRGAPVALAAVDANGDGRRDLVSANQNGTVSVLVNLGGGGFAAARSYRVGPDPSALAVADVNGDRRPDLAVSRAGGGVHAVTVLLNRGRGSFGRKRDYATGADPVSVAIGDVNGDGKPDLVTANNVPATASVLLNQGRGSFRAKLDYATGALPIAVAIGKFDANRRRDLVIPTYNGIRREPVTVLVNTPGLCNVQDVWGLRLAAASQTLALGGCGAGIVTHAPSKGFAAGRVIGQSPQVGAVLRSGTVDLTVSDGPGPGRIAAAPSFSAAKSHATPKGGQQVAIADLNGDGAPDVVSGNCGNTVSVLLNGGHGTLTPRQDYRVSDCPDTLTLADLNGDGRPDIVAGTDGGSISVLLNHGDGTFAARHDYDAGDGPTFGTNYVAVGDLSGDGRPDLAIASDGGFSVYTNNGDGMFGAKRDYSTAGGESVAIADLNGDGKADLAFDDGYTVTVVLNRGGGDLEPAQQAHISPTDASNLFVGELTGDGRTALVATDDDGSAVDLLLNDAGTLRPYADYRAAADLGWVAIGDVNGDGTQDIVSVGKTVSIQRNRGDGTFTAGRAYAMGGKKHPPRAVALGDLNGDGKLDLVTANGATVLVRLQTG